MVLNEAFFVPNLDDARRQSVHATLDICERRLLLRLGQVSFSTRWSKFRGDTYAEKA